MSSSYLQRIANYPTFRFIIEVSALAFLSRFFITLPVIIILSVFGVELGEPNITSLNLDEAFFETLVYAIIFAPFIETILFQAIPIKILKFLRIPVRLIILSTTLLFAYAHLDEGLVNFIGMVPIGFLFVWSFIVRQKLSLVNAIFCVFIIHGLTNLLATVIYLMGN